MHCRRLPLDTQQPHGLVYRLSAEHGAEAFSQLGAVDDNIDRCLLAEEALLVRLGPPRYLD